MHKVFPTPATFETGRDQVAAQVIPFPRSAPPAAVPQRPAERKCHPAITVAIALVGGLGGWIALIKFLEWIL